MALILILDDRATNRNIYARLAAAIEPGIDVEVFADPLDALEWLQANRVDLVITDYRMPGMDGAEFTRRYRAMPNGSVAPVLVVTAYDDRSFRLRALDAGATDFLQTPIDHFELVTRARNLLALGRRAAAPAIGPAATARPRPGGPDLPAAPGPRPGIPPDPPRHGLAEAPPGFLADRPLAPASGPAAGQPPGAPPEEVSADDFGRILDSLPVLVSLSDRVGICRYVNAAQAAWAGRPAADLVGRPAALLAAPDRALRSRQEDRAVFETGRALPAQQEETTGPDGTRRTLLTLKTPLPDAAGGTAAVMAVSLELPGGLPGTPILPVPPWGIADG